MKCPCTRTCPDRNAKCHMKGNCPHGYDQWLEEHERERDEVNRKKAFEASRWTDAEVKRRINFIKHGQVNVR